MSMAALVVLWVLAIAGFWAGGVLVMMVLITFCLWIDPREGGWFQFRRL